MWYRRRRIAGRGQGQISVIGPFRTCATAAPTVAAGVHGVPGRFSNTVAWQSLIQRTGKADQPFSDSTGRWTISYNGELFNYREIRRELETRGVRFRTQSDTEVVLASLIADGPKALSAFRGMFSLVLWDNEERELLAARDQIGVKPLYYSADRGVFVAASELRTLIAHPSVRPRLNPTRVVEYLAFGFVLGADTLLDGVSSADAWPRRPSQRRISLRLRILGCAWRSAVYVPIPRPSCSSVLILLFPHHW